jgi:hypothetical protein
MKKKNLHIDGTAISVGEGDHISLTDIAKRFNEENPSALITNWLRNRDTIEFLGAWEGLHNPRFNPIEFDRIRSEAGVNSFVLSVKRWTEETGAIGIRSSAGRYGGTSAHADIAFGFAYWISPVFQLYVSKEFQRLKQVEQGTLAWNLRRELAKVNYDLHTQAVRDVLLPKLLPKRKMEGVVYASEADVLNMALFGMTAREWQAANPNQKGNMRDQASIEQLTVLANLESLNAVLIADGLPQYERLEKLNAVAVHQMRVLAKSTKRLG